MIQNIIVVLVLGRLRYELSGYRGLLGFLWGERFKNVLAQRPIVRFSESFEELAALKQLFMSICLFRLRDTRIEEDSDNSTISKDLFVRNVFEPSSPQSHRFTAIKRNGEGMLRWA